jgi:hypothetical protein
VLISRISSSSSIGTTTLSWASACSTAVEHSQQKGFTGVPLPAASRTPNLEENQRFRAFQLSPQEAPTSEARLAKPAGEGGTMGKKWPRIFPKVTTSTSLLGSFTCRKARHGTDGFTSPPKEGALRIFSSKKSDSCCRVWTREVGYQRPARYL